ncbi:hypothetical protein EPO05_04230 [Patescibacteria group bacterium]|nr:MAG: hypothetical protein EPO05_04230 [Patescibacteria group bacterium]
MLTFVASRFAQDKSRMYLKKVEIAGFKSFANKTVLDFMPARDDVDRRVGITAVVGPNGSGKSNVADAIRWVMGEQSMKNLRGKKSEDIIFAGSGKKARLSSAHATLHFDNSDKRIPLEFSEVAITRKIFRSGESEYLINGSKVRLLDVVDLLAKAGIGRESYCVINQGMSDAVLNATMAERRMILEDAAGVKQYQIKKERSIRKLESTEENLSRVKDLINEIEPHLKMLKRQSEKAQKGKEIADLLKQGQLQLFSYLWHTFQTEKATFSATKNDLGIKMMNIQREVDKLNDELSQESKGMQSSGQQDELQRKREETRRAVNELERELVMTEGRIEIEKEKQAQQQKIEHVPVDLHYVQSKLQTIRESQEKLIARITNAETLEELQDIKEFARAIQQSLHDLSTEVGEGEVEIKKLPTPDTDAGLQEIERLMARTAEIKGKIAELSEAVQLANQKINEEIEAERRMRQRFFELERSLSQKQHELNQLKDQFNEAKIELARVDVREEDLQNEIRNELKLEVTDLKYDGTPVDRSVVERDITRLKLQLEQIGGIDPLIMAEYEDTRNRFEFLSKESEDLQRAMDSLREVVKEMEQKINEVFEEAFEKINKEFTNYFRIIFGGGNAHLIKSKVKTRKMKTEAADGEEGEANEAVNVEDASEKEETGVEIFACPPGKKISHLSMLSGGERALTSLALLFAIISYNPPPFAILDEVEAALDEANSRRFGRILMELSGNTQFIAITHNRETMRQASLLYGVTMGDDGISKILSVRLDQVGQGGKIKE